MFFGNKMALVALVLNTIPMLSISQTEFEKFKAERTQVYSDFRNERDTSYTNYLRKNWQPYNVESGLVPKLKAKPIKPYEAPLDTLSLTNVEQLPNVVLSTPIDRTVSATIPVLSGTDKILFYGYPIDVVLKKPLTRLKESSEVGVATYWDAYLKEDSLGMVRQLNEIRVADEMNDWVYYLFLQKVAKKICENRDEQQVWLFFVLNQSNLSAKVGKLKSGELVLLLPIKQQVLQTNFVNINNQKYYVFGIRKSDEIFTFSESFSKEAKPLNLLSDRLISEKFTTEIRKREVAFLADTETITLQIPYDMGLVALYDDMPQAEYSVCFSTKMSATLYKELYKQLAPYVKEKNQYEAVSFLLHFVQKAFPYQRDNEQFGREKVMYADEMFAYPFSDCEDRAILFARLVKEMLGMKVIGLKYPEHVATAVKFDGEISGTLVKFKNEKYAVCDPTYIGADVGAQMPRFQNVKSEVIEFD